MLISIGEILVDIFDDGVHQDILPGGAPFNVACNALMYTDKVSFIGAVGNDDNGKMLIDVVSSKGFTNPYIKVLKDHYTTRAIVSLKNGERSFRFERDLGADYCLETSDVDISLINDGDIVHIGSLMLSYQEGRDFFHNVIKKIRDHSKAKISFDINYRDDIFNGENEAKKIFIDALKEADVIKFTEEELELLTNTKDIRQSLKMLLSDNQIAVVTLGKQGSIFYSQDQFIEVPSYPLTPVDTTGAGDAFYSYFLYSLDQGLDLHDDNQIKEALKRANIVGGFATQKKGAINVAPSLDEIDNFLKQH